MAKKLIKKPKKFQWGGFASIAERVEDALPIVKAYATRAKRDLAAPLMSVSFDKKNQKALEKLVDEEKSNGLIGRSSYLTLTDPLTDLLRQGIMDMLRQNLGLRGKYVDLSKLGESVEDVVRKIASEPFDISFLGRTRRGVPLNDRTAGITEYIYKKISPITLNGKVLWVRNKLPILKHEIEHRLQRYLLKSGIPYTLGEKDLLFDTYVPIDGGYWHSLREPFSLSIDELGATNNDVRNYIQNTMGLHSHPFYEFSLKFDPQTQRYVPRSIYDEMIEDGFSTAYIEDYNRLYKNIMYDAMKNGSSGDVTRTLGEFNKNLAKSLSKIGVGTGAIYLGILGLNGDNNDLEVKLENKSK